MYEKVTACVPRRPMIYICGNILGSRHHCDNSNLYFTQMKQKWKNWSKKKKRINNYDNCACLNLLSYHSWKSVQYMSVNPKLLLNYLESRHGFGLFWMLINWSFFQSCPKLCKCKNRPVYSWQVLVKAVKNFTTKNGFKYQIVSMHNLWVTD